MCLCQDAQRDFCSQLRHKCERLGSRPCVCDRKIQMRRSFHSLYGTFTHSFTVIYTKSGDRSGEWDFYCHFCTPKAQRNTEKPAIMVWRIVKVLEFACEHCYRCFTKEADAVVHEQECRNLHNTARLIKPSIVADDNITNAGTTPATAKSRNSEVMKELTDEEISFVCLSENDSQTNDDSMTIVVEAPKAKVAQENVPIADSSTNTLVEAESTNFEDIVKSPTKPDNGNRPFVCRACDAAFDNRPEMAKHKREPHKCSHCERVLANAMNLLGHVEALHEHRKPYACVTCYERFSTTSQVKCCILEEFTLGIFFAYFLLRFR